MAAVECCARAHTALVSFERARHEAAALALPHGRTEDVALSAALGRTAAVPIRAPSCLPPFDQAAMDGYAVRLASSSERAFPVLGGTRAGDPPRRLAMGAAHRVLTGAALPLGTDTVVMQEDVRRGNGFVHLDVDVASGTHIRRAGEDVAAGDIVLPRGRVIGWPEITLLAALGVDRVSVARPVRVALVVTGSELVAAPGRLRPGAIRDSNGPMLSALLGGAEAHIASIVVADECALLARALDRAADEADLVVTTGGASVGDEDHLRDAVARVGGTIVVHGVAMKPGKPVMLGRLRDALHVGLPGNPQAAACGALAFVRPMLRRLLGREGDRRPTAQAGFRAAAPAGRAELLPVVLAAEGGRLVARSCGARGSHRLLPMAAADGFAVVSAGSAVEIGDVVEVLPFGRLEA